MFCEKCGNKLNDTDKFCMKCGAPVRPVVPVTPQPEQQAPVESQPEEQAPVETQPEQQAPVEVQPEEQAPVTPQPEQQAPAETQPEQHAPVTPQPVPAPYPPVQQPPVNPQPVPPAPKKPMSKGTKRAILFSCIGVAAVALFLVLLFTVIIPALRPTFDPSKYLTMTLYDYDSGFIYDGNIAGEISVDTEKIRADYPNILNNDDKEYILDEILLNMTVNYEEKGNKDNTDYGLGYAYFEGLKKNSVLTVTTSWDSLLYSRQEIQDYAGKELGVKLICKDIRKEMRVVDAAKESDVEIKAVTKLDILSYLKNNDLIAAKQDDQKKYRIGIQPFNATIGDVTVSNESFGNLVEVSRGDSEMTIVAFDLPDEVKAGDNVKIQYSDFNIFAEGGGLELTGEPFYYTVVVPDELNADTAKKNVTAIKTYVTENVDKLFKDAKNVEKITVSNVYYVTGKTSADPAYLVVTYQNDKLKDYGTLVMTAKGYFSDGKLVYEGEASKGSEGKTIADAEKACTYLDTKNYNVTKL